MLMGTCLASSNLRKDKNFIFNSSFELGTSRSTKIGNVEWVKGGAYDGEYCVRLSNYDIILGSYAVDSLPGLFTFSGYFKSDHENTWLTMVIFGTKPIGDTSFMIGTEWKRCSITLHIPEIGKQGNQPLRLISPRFFWGNPHGSCNLWADAIQLERGALTDYSPKETPELGVYTTNYGNVFDKTQKVRYFVGVQTREKGTRDLRLEWSVCDFEGRKVLTGRRDLSHDKGQILRQEVDIPTRQLGYFEVSFKLYEDETGVIDSVILPFVRIEYNPPLYPAFDSQFGICEHTSLIGNDDAMQSRMFDVINNCGYRWVRVCFLWKDIYRRDSSAPDYSRFDRWVSLLQKRKLRILGILTEGWPEWAKVDDKPNIQAWKSFCSEIAARYKGTVQAWEVANEPDQFLGSVSGGLSIDEWILVHQAAFESIKFSNPVATVVCDFDLLSNPLGKRAM